MYRQQTQQISIYAALYAEIKKQRKEKKENSIVTAISIQRQ